MDYLNLSLNNCAYSDRGGEGGREAIGEGGYWVRIDSI